MIPIAKPASPGTASTPQQETRFRIFQDERGRWCTRSDDGMAGATCFAREAVRRETAGLPALVVRIAPELQGVGNLRLMRTGTTRS